jgi:hypothetical protein
LLALLWPEQWILKSALDARLSKLINRLRTEHQIHLHVKEECVFLDSTDWQQVRVDPFQVRPRHLDHLWRELEGREPSQRLLNWETLVEGYSLGLTQSRVLLQNWIDRNWIERIGAGRGTRYRILPPFTENARVD